MSWQTFRIADSIQANRVSHELMEGLFAALALHGASKDVGIFSYLNLEDGSTDYYFTPRAAEIAASLAKRYNAKPCGVPPLIEGMSLLAGDQRSRELLSKKT